MLPSNAQVTGGLFCDTDPLEVSNGQVWNGLFCLPKLRLFPKKAPESGGYTVEMDEMEVLDLCSIIIASGVLDGDS